MSKLQKTHEPQTYQQDIYEQWESSGAFTPTIDWDKNPFVIPMPPPNVTGVLHAGHASMLAYQDIMARWHRMLGDPTLWYPGTDHAAIATQEVVERRIFNETGKTRHEIGREKLLQEIYDFAEQSKKTILSQTRLMGASCDWTREKYTMDEVESRAVREMFVRMYDDGLIYRGDRIVNWCPRCGSTLANDEVEYKECEEKLYWIKYGPFVLATSRPETKLGDTAVAVHPDDDRYKDLVGKKIKVQGVLGEFEVVVVADHAVKMDFGSGAVKVTPAHSFTDAEIAERHNLPSKQIINKEGRMMENCGKYAGMTTREAREAIVADMEKMGLIEKIESYDHSLSVCGRCKTVIEPMPSKQWFIDVKKEIPDRGKSLQQYCQDFVNEKEMRIIPSRFEKNYFNWVDNFRDWCISRQIWWGHQIPAWYRKKKILDMKFYGEEMWDALSSGKKTIETRAWKEKFAALRPGDFLRVTWREPETKAPLAEPLLCEITAIHHFPSVKAALDELGHERIAPHMSREEMEKWYLSIPHFEERVESGGIFAFELKTDGVEEVEVFVGHEAPKGDGWQRDPDTLDTWFSSGLWPFGPHGWPDETEDFKYFTTVNPKCQVVMETMWDILTLWVVRMCVMNAYATGKAPFQNVYLHGPVTDRDGKKMSKSRPETCIDPREVIDKYGTDAFRMSLTMGSSPGNPLQLTEDKIIGCRNFCNKLWNVARFILERDDFAVACERPEPQTLAQAWILNCLEDLKLHSQKSLEQFKFSAYGEALYDWLWNTFADWYLEIAKFEPNSGAVLSYCLREFLKMAHPLIPFITEKIWQEGEFSDRQLVLESWPRGDKKLIQTEPQAQMNKIQELIKAVRNARSEAKIEPAKWINLIIEPSENRQLFEANLDIIKNLARCEDITFAAKPTGSVLSLVAGTDAAHIPLAGLVDVAAEREKLTKEKQDLEKYISTLAAKLDNKTFTDNAPKLVVEQSRAKLAESRERLQKIDAQLADLN